jgi:hypothetical protein
VILLDIYTQPSHLPMIATLNLLVALSSRTLVACGDDAIAQGLGSHCMTIQLLYVCAPCSLMVADHSWSWAPFIDQLQFTKNFFFENKFTKNLEISSSARLDRSEMDAHVSNNQPSVVVDRGACDPCTCRRHRPPIPLPVNWQVIPFDCLLARHVTTTMHVRSGIASVRCFISRFWLLIEPSRSSDPCDHLSWSACFK